MERQPIGLQRVAKKEHEPPITPRDTYARLLTACHLELSALALLSLPTHKPGKTPTITAREIDPTADRPSIKAMSDSIKHYFQDVFPPLSLATGDIFINRTTGDFAETYSATPLGRKLQGAGFYLISQLTRLNDRNGTDIALPQILTKSATGHRRKEEEELPITRRSPFIRASIIENLYHLSPDQTLPPHHVTAAPLDIYHESIRPHVQELLEAKLITDNREGTEQGKSFRYTAIPGQSLPDVSRIKSKTPYDVAEIVYEHMANILQDNPTATFGAQTLLQQLYDQYITERANKGKAPVGKNSFRTEMSRLLSSLEKTGFLKKTPTNLQLTPIGREIAEILAQVKKACEDPMVLEKMNSDFQMNFPAFLRRNAQTLLENHKKYGHAHGVDEERKQQLFRILLAAPQGMSRKSILEQMKMHAGAHISQLIEDGVVLREWGNPRTLLNRGQRGRLLEITLSQKARKILEKTPNISYKELKELVNPATGPDNTPL